MKNPDPQFFCDLSDKCNVKSEKRCSHCLVDYMALQRFINEVVEVDFFNFYPYSRKEKST